MTECQKERQNVSFHYICRTFLSDRMQFCSYPSDFVRPQHQTPGMAQRFFAFSEKIASGLSKTVLGLSCRDLVSENKGVVCRVSILLVCRFLPASFRLQQDTATSFGDGPQILLHFLKEQFLEFRKLCLA